MTISICFVSLNNFAVLSDQGGVAHIGGAEVQQMYIAQGLVQRGHSVSFVTLDHGQADGVEINGIRVFKAYDRNAGIRRLRFVHPRWTGLCAAMKRADADVYYQRTACEESGQVCLWCRGHRKRFVYSVANDSDCDPRLPALGSFIERGFFRYALRHADAVIAQTQKQRLLLAQAGRQDAAWVPSCRPLPPLPPDGIRQPAGRPRVLWVGRFNPSKRPEWCLDLAARCPGLDFDVVGSANANASRYENLRSQAGKLSNITMHGYLPHAAMDELYRRSSVLLSTSVPDTEGFPNTFLEAWSHARPVVSTVDPDGIVQRNGLGRIADSIDGMAHALVGLLDDGSQWCQAAQRGRDYVATHHSLEAVMREYEKVFRFSPGPAPDEPVSPVSAPKSS